MFSHGSDVLTMVCMGHGTVHVTTYHQPIERTIKSTHPRSAITRPRFELDPSNLKFDLTFDLGASSSKGNLRSPSVQHHPPQI